LGLDPTSAVRLKLGEEAAAELDAIPDTQELRLADEAITRSNSNSCDEGIKEFQATIQNKVSNINEILQNNSLPNFKNFSFIDLLAFYVATGGIENYRD
jgi:hypothetical protein